MGFFPIFIWTDRIEAPNIILKDRKTRNNTGFVSLTSQFSFRHLRFSRPTWKKIRQNGKNGGEICRKDTLENLSSWRQKPWTSKNRVSELGYCKHGMPNGVASLNGGSQLRGQFSYSKHHIRPHLETGRGKESKLWRYWFLVKEGWRNVQGPF